MFNIWLIVISTLAAVGMLPTSSGKLAVFGLTSILVLVSFALNHDHRRNFLYRMAKVVGEDLMKSDTVYDVRPSTYQCTAGGALFQLRQSGVDEQWQNFQIHSCEFEPDRIPKQIVRNGEVVKIHCY